jgi:hypothetical protein
VYDYRPAGYCNTKIVESHNNTSPGGGNYSSIYSVHKLLVQILVSSDATPTGMKQWYRVAITLAVLALLAE